MKKSPKGLGELFPLPVEEKQLIGMEQAELPAMHGKSVVVTMMRKVEIDAKQELKRIEQRLSRLLFQERSKAPASAVNKTRVEELFYAKMLSSHIGGMLVHVDPHEKIGLGGATFNDIVVKSIELGRMMVVAEHRNAEQAYKSGTKMKIVGAHASRAAAKKRTKAVPSEEEFKRLHKIFSDQSKKASVVKQKVIKETGMSHRAYNQCLKMLKSR